MKLEGARKLWKPFKLFKLFHNAFDIEWRNWFIVISKSFLAGLGFVVFSILFGLSTLLLLPDLSADLNSEPGIILSLKKQKKQRSDRSLEVELPILLGQLWQTNRQIGQPTDRLTNWPNDRHLFDCLLFNRSSVKASEAFLFSSIMKKSLL